MARESTKGSLKDRRVGAGTVAGAIVVLLAFLVWQAYVYFGSSLPHIPSKEERFMMQKAEECQGDIRKLNEKDQAILMKMMGRQAGMGISSMYNSAHHPRSRPFW